MESQNILHADLLDILFEGRNKNYGAYELRKTYSKRMLTALALTAACCIVLYVVYRTVSTMDKAVAPAVIEVEIKPVDLIDKKQETVVMPPPAKKLELTPIRQVMSTTPLIVKEATPEEMPPTQEDLSQAKIALANFAGNNATDIIAPPADGKENGIISLPGKKADKKDSVFMKVEIESSYPGGMSAWMRFLNKKLAPNYPQEAIEKGIQGRVVVRFIVDLEGTVSEVQAISGPEELKEVAMKVIRQSGKWIPAIQNGNTVKSYKWQPITFSLE